MRPFGRTPLASISVVVGLLCLLLAAGCEDPATGGIPGVDVEDERGGDRGEDRGTDPDEDVVDEPDLGEEIADDALADGEDGGDLAPDAEEEPDVPLPDLVPPCPPDHCDIEGLCWENETTNPDNPCEACLVSVARDAWSADDEGTCDDDDLCTSDDYCSEGACVGTVNPCEDGNECTAGTCNPDTGRCEQAPIDGPCNDGNLCTLGDTCYEGECRGGGDRLACRTDNRCALAACDPEIGCTTIPRDGISCDDNNVCTQGDTCMGGECQPGEDLLRCADDNLCTVDYCDPVDGCQSADISDLCSDDNLCTAEFCDRERGCVYPFIAGTCDDGNACTQLDACNMGVCRGNPVLIEDDDNICTTEYCDPELGPVVEFEDFGCDDGDLCTVGDYCSEGGCVSGTEPLDCDDDNVCTTNMCGPDLGCINTPMPGNCDDGNQCTLIDQCVDGECLQVPRNCDDFNACTVDSCDPDEGCVYTPVAHADCRPFFDVTFPPRGATVVGSSGQVVVSGTVSSGAAPIQQVLLDGRPCDFDPVDDSFSCFTSGVIGGNMFRLEATDGLGSTTERVQGFHYSSGYNLPTNPAIKNGMVAPGFGLFLSEVVLDDGNRADVDDFATIFQLILQNLDLEGFFDTSGPIANQCIFICPACYCLDVWVLGASFGNVTVSMDALNDEIRLVVTLFDLEVPIAIVDEGDTPGGASGRIRAESVRIQLPIRFRVNGSNELFVPAPPESEVVVSISKLRYDSGSDILDFIINLFSGLIQDAVVDALRSAIAEDLAPVLGEAFSALAFDQEIELPAFAPGGEPATIRFVTDFYSAGTLASGVTFEERAGVYGEAVTPYTNNGAVQRALCLIGGPQYFRVPGVSPMEIVLSDDTINEILWAAWRAGLLEFEVPADILGDVDFDGLEITDLSLIASGMLAPVISDCNPDHRLRVNISDLGIQASMRITGIPIVVNLWVSLDATMSISADSEGIGLGIDGIERTEIEVTMADPAQVAFEPVIESAIGDALGEGLLDLIGGTDLGSFPLPEIDLSESIDGVPPGTVIALEPTSVERVDGNIVVSGTLR
jgi:hypothetical protein